MWLWSCIYAKSWMSHSRHNCFCCELDFDMLLVLMLRAATICWVHPICQTVFLLVFSETLLSWLSSPTFKGEERWAGWVWDVAMVQQLSSQEAVCFLRSGPLELWSRPAARCLPVQEGCLSQAPSLCFPDARLSLFPVSIPADLDVCEWKLLSFSPYLPVQWQSLYLYPFPADHLMS